MKKNLFKEKVLNRDFLCGTHTVLNCPEITRILGSIGFDFIWIDLEHTAIDCGDLAAHLNCAMLTDAAAVVRVPVLDRTCTKRVLEMGPDGIIFPMVNTPEEADQAMKLCLYPPDGNRGFGPLGAVSYGLRDTEEYVRSVNKELTRFVQIETIEAVKNLPQIIRNPWIDGYIFGPCDLSASIGEITNVFGKNNINLIKEAVAILQEAGKSIGVSTGSADPEVTAFWSELGINIISSGADYGYIHRGAAANLQNLRALPKSK